MANFALKARRDSAHSPNVATPTQKTGELVKLTPAMKRILVNLLGALVVGAALHLQLSTALAQGMTVKLLTTFTNPTPATGDRFGFAVAALGRDRMLIGACQDDTDAADAGAAYLYSTNGALLTSFTNPTPAADDYFGFSVIAVGNDRVLVGAWSDDTGARDAGAAYLFNTNGALLTIFTNPVPLPYDNFGYSLAASGNDRLLIGSVGDNSSVDNAGAAYLFSTNGVLLATFTNPTPAAGDSFGCSVAVLGNDRVLIGAYGDDVDGWKFDAGAAYLFSTDGSLLTTFTNPTPAIQAYFGNSMAALGSDRVLIGTPGGDTGAGKAGLAYLFATNGNLLTTFTNPTPAQWGYFGISVASVESDRVMIGAHLSGIGSNGVGAVYLFRTNGTLLTTITNPTPATNDAFGYSAAVVGEDRILIGAWRDGTAATDAGAAYLFSIAEQMPEAPNLSIRLTTTNTVVVTWPSPSTGWTLQENSNGVASVNWSNVTSGIQDDGTNKSLVVNPPTGSRFYRLFKP
jgi:hypothetical protein